MELRRYWDIARRRWWLIAALTAAAVVLGSFWTIRQPHLYTASARLVVSQVPTPRSEVFYDYDRYYNWQASEYIIDDYTQILKSKAFARDVIKRLSLENQPAEGEIVGAIGVSREHRILTISASWPDAAAAQEIANAAADTLVENRMKYYGRPGTDDVAASVIDYSEGAGSSATRGIFNLGLAVVLGFAVGVVAVFVADYLDDSVKSTRDAEVLLGLPVLGEIPRQVESRSIRMKKSNL